MSEGETIALLLIVYSVGMVIAVGVIVMVGERASRNFDRRRSEYRKQQRERRRRRKIGE